jgi:hypothetical protein
MRWNDLSDHFLEFDRFLVFRFLSLGRFAVRAIPGFSFDCGVCRGFGLVPLKLSWAL